MLQDTRGQIWIGTNAGLNVVNRSGNGIEHLGQDTIFTMLEDAHGKIWMGTPNSGIQILDTSTGAVKEFLSPREVDNIIGGKGTILIVGMDGIDIVDSAHKIIQHIGKAQGLRNDSVTNILEDENGKMWIGYYSNGVDVLDMQHATIHHLEASQCMKDSFITDIKENGEGNVWVSTFHSGEFCCYVIDKRNNTIRSVDNGAKLSEGGKILLPDVKGGVWIGTPDGLKLVNAQEDSLFAFSAREGLPDNYIFSLNQYGNAIYAATMAGLTIITAPSSTEQKWQMESLGKARGINNYIEAVNSNLFTEHGEFFWGDKGLTVIDRPESTATAPPTYVTGISISGEPQYFTSDPWGNMNKDDTLKSADQDTFYLKGQMPVNTNLIRRKGMKWSGITGGFNMPVDLHLPYDQNYLQFHFAQVNLGSTDSTWYEYILDGIDKKWSKTSNSYSENYLNLNPGNYTFKVSSLYEGKWSHPVEFEFTIMPPWWKTWWAYTLYAIVVLVIMSLVVRYRSRQLKAENIHLEEKVTQRTNELKKSLEELKETQAQLIQSEKMASLGELTAGIAHEIQNPLNFVNNFSEVNTEMIDELQTELKSGNVDEAINISDDIKENEQKINYHGKRADAIVKGMLQHSRASTGQKELTDINKLADEYLRLSYHGMRAKDKSFNAEFKTDFDEAIGKINAVPQDIGRVLLNLLNNAFYAVNEKSKTADENYQPTVSVQTKKLNEKVEIRVSDNGNGIPQNIVDKIFQPFFTTKPTGSGTGLGLSLAYDIIKAHGGDIRVETKEEEGSEFIIRLSL
jgi:signal transduction histidine kinase